MINTWTCTILRLLYPNSGKKACFSYILYGVIHLMKLLKLISSSKYMYILTCWWSRLPHSGAFVLAEEHFVERSNLSVFSAWQPQVNLFQNSNRQRTVA